MRSFFSKLFLTGLLIAFSIALVNAAEPVIKVKHIYRTRGYPYKSLFYLYYPSKAEADTTWFEVNRNDNINEVLDEAKNLGKIFYVYTTAEVDSKITTVDKKLDQKVSGLNTTIDKNRKADAARLEKSISDKVAAIPDRLLSSEAKESIKKELLTELDSRLKIMEQQLRQELITWLEDRDDKNSP